MAIFDTDLIGGLNPFDGMSSKFHYGHHPSIVMWSNGPAPVPQDEDFFGGLGKSLESLVTTGSPESFSSFKFDAMVSEEHDARAKITSFPVSSGFVVSDHTIKQNRILKLSAVAVNMQNSAMWAASVQGLSVAAGAIFDSPIIPILGGIVGGVASAFETSDRIQSTYNLFNTFRTTGQKLYISTILGPYLNCVVTGLATKHDKNTAAMLSIEITLEELQVIGTDALATEARKAMESMYDYSEFAKIATSMGIGVLGGAPLPGLGAIGDSPSKQLNTLQGKLDKLSSPLSSVKGRIL